MSDLAQPSSFSSKLPLLQLYLDSTSLKEFEICPKRYYYGIIRGMVPVAENTHLTFGILIHKSLEVYHSRRFTGQSHEDALRGTIEYALKASWDRKLNRPWTPVQDKVGKVKNRSSLIRTLVWYLDEYQDDMLQTAIINGRPAIELAFTMDSGYTASTGEQFTLCGFLDRIIVQQGKYFITDVKTTSQKVKDENGNPNYAYFRKYNPDVQMSLYTLAGHAVFDIPAEGVFIDACQIKVEESLFSRQFTARSTEQITEWQEELIYHLMNLNQCAASNKWPKNDSVCQLYGGCPYIAVCAKFTPAEAERELTTYYQPRSWDPLARRTDV